MQGIGSSICRCLWVPPADPVGSPVPQRSTCLPAPPGASGNSGTTAAAAWEPNPVPILELYELDSVLASILPSDQAAHRARSRLGSINEEQFLILPLTPEAGQLVVFANGLGNLARAGLAEAAVAAAEIFHWTAPDNAGEGE